MVNTAPHWQFAPGKRGLIASETHVPTPQSNARHLTSTLFALYQAALNNPHDTQLNKLRVLDSMKANSVRIAEFSRLLFLEQHLPDIGILTPINPHCLYTAALVEFQAWKENKEVFCKQRFDDLKSILGHFGKRWLIAGMFSLVITSPDMLGFSVELYADLA